MGDYEALQARLMSHIRIDDSGCWNWTGTKNAEGYGNIGIGSRKNGTRKTMKAHRASYLAFKGVNPAGLDVCHKCDNPACINPEHLFLGTAKDNIHDMIRKGRRRHVKFEDCPTAKLTIPQVIEARELRKSGASYYSMAKKYGVYRETMRQAVIGKTWQGIDAHKPGGEQE